jgi:hypothetical protein
MFLFDEIKHISNFGPWEQPKDLILDFQTNTSKLSVFICFHKKLLN